MICLHPPYPVLVIAFMIAGYGNGLADAAYNAYIGNMANANELLGFLHGLYGFGAVISPLVATSMITKVGIPWYGFYYVMVSPTYSLYSRPLRPLDATPIFWDAV
jgi:fucose permease